MSHDRRMTKPAAYEITLKGNVGARSLRPLIDDFTVSTSEPGITRLVGVIQDGSQMHGLVAHFASMGVDIVSITPTDSSRKEQEMTHPTSSPNSQSDELNEKERLEAAKLYVRQLQAFYIHASTFVAGMAIMFVVNLATNLAAGIADNFWAWWSLWALVGWGAGIAVHGMVVRLNRPSAGSSSWEQRQIDKVLAK